MGTLGPMLALLLNAGTVPEVQFHAQSAIVQTVTDANETDVVQGAADRDRRLTVPVRIGGNGPFHFVVDTGAQRTVLSTAIAAKLALVPGLKAGIVGVGGRAEVDTAVIDEFGLGRRSYFGVIAPLLERANIGADGIVGTDNMQGQRVLLDFKHNLMAIDEAKKLGGNRGYEIVVNARRRSGQLIVTDAEIDRVHVNVVIDTGAETSMGNLALRRALTRRNPTERVTLRSVTGQEITADMGFAGKLTIDKVDISNVLIAYADAPPFKALGLEDSPSILLGMRELRLFERVAIDFRAHRVLFDIPDGM